MIRGLLISTIIGALLHIVPTPFSHRSDTFESMVARTEGVTCDRITAYAEGEAPSCKEIYKALSSGRALVAKYHPEAAKIKFSSVHLIRPPRHYSINDDKPFLSAYDDPDGQGTWFILGQTHEGTYPVVIEYAYEDVLRHEGTHAFWLLVAPNEERPEAAQKDGKGKYIWQITCHGTPDDPFRSIAPCDNSSQASSF